MNFSRFKKPNQLSDVYQPYEDPNAPEGWSPSLRSSFAKYRNQMIGPMGFQAASIQEAVEAGGSFDKHLTRILKLLQKNDRLKNIGIDQSFIQSHGMVFIDNIPVSTTNDTIFGIGGQIFVLDEKLTGKKDPKKPEFTTQLTAQAVMAVGALVPGKADALPAMESTDLSNVVAGTINIDLFGGPSILAEADRRAYLAKRHYLDLKYAVEEADELSHNQRMEIYEQVIAKLIVNPALQYAQTGNPKTGEATVVVPHNVASPEAQALAATEVHEAQDLLRAVVKIAGLKPQELTAYMNNLHPERMTDQEWTTNRDWVSIVSVLAHEAVGQERSGKDVNYAALKARADAVLGDTRRFYTISEKAPVKRWYDPRSQQQRPGLKAMVEMDADQGAIDTSSGEWKQIGNTGAYHNGSEIAFVTNVLDSLGYNIVAKRARFSKQDNGVMTINGRIVSGGEEEIASIAGKTVTAFVRGAGSKSGARMASKAFDKELAGRRFEAVSSATEQYAIKQANAIRVTAPDMQEPIQKIMGRVLAGDTPIFFRDNQQEGYKAIPVIQATPGAFVENPEQGHEATAYIGRKVEKWNKDIQKAARDYKLQMEGRQFTSPIRMIGAQAPEELTRLNTVYSNMLEYSKLESWLATRARDANQLYSTVTMRIPYTPSASFEPETNPGSMTFDKERGLLRIGKGDDANNFYQVKNWQDFSAQSVRKERYNGKDYLVVTGKAAFDPLKEQMKNWLAKGMVVSGGLFGLEDRGVEYLSVQGDNIRQNAYAFLSSYYAHEGGGAEGIRRDLAGLLDDEQAAEKILKLGAIKDPKTGEAITDIQRARSIVQAEMKTTYEKHDPLTPDVIPGTASKEYVFLDIESGDVMGEGHAEAKDIGIVSVGAVVTDEDLNPIKRYYRVVNDPGKTFTAEAEKVHGFSQERLGRAQTSVDEAMDEVNKLVQGRTVVGHNIKRHDMPILAARGVKFGEAIDTFEIVDRAKKQGEYPQISRGQETVYRTLVDPNATESHKAILDAAQSVPILGAMVKKGWAKLQHSRPEIKVGGDNFVWGGSKNIDNLMFFLASDKAKQHTTRQTMEVPMSRAGYEYYMGTLGAHSQERGVGVHEVDVEKTFGDNPYAIKPIKVTQNVFGYADMGHQFTQAWAHGEAQLSLEEMTNIARNQGNLSDETHQLMMQRAMPQWMSHGYRARVNSEAMLKTYLLNQGVEAEKIGANVMEYEDFERELQNFSAENDLNLKSDYYKIINDERFLSKVVGKYIHLGAQELGGQEAFMLPADIMRNIAHYQPGQRVTFTHVEEEGKEKTRPDYDTAPVEEQSVRAINLFKTLVERGTTTGQWEQGVASLRTEIETMATGRSTRKRAFGSEVGREGVYVFDDRLPTGTIIMGKDSLKAWFRTEDYDEANRMLRQNKDLFAMVHRRPDSNSAMSAGAVAKILAPGTLTDISAENDTMLVSGDLRDTFQGDSDGDRMHAMLIAQNREIDRMFALGARLGEAFREGGRDDPLARLSRGYSSLIGREVKFDSIGDYWKFVRVMSDTSKGVNMSEWAKRAKDVGKESAFIPEGEAGFKQWNLGATLEEGEIQQMAAEGIAHKQMAESYNVFVRRMPASGQMMGDMDPEFAAHSGRWSYYTYQTALDKVLYSSGLREVMGLIQNYRPENASFKDFMSGKPGNIPEQAGIQAFGSGSRTAPIALISGILGTHELRGGGKNLAWLNDVARSLTKDKEQQRRIIDIVSDRLGFDAAEYRQSGGDVESSIAMASFSEESLQKMLDDKKLRLDMARDIYKDVFSQDDAAFMGAGGSVSDVFYSSMLERSARGNKQGRIGEGGAALLHNLHKLNPQAFDALMKSGKVQRAKLNLVGEGTGETAQDLQTLIENGGEDVLFGQLGNRLSPDLMKWVRGGMQSEPHVDPQNPGEEEMFIGIGPSTKDPNKIVMHTANQDEIEVSPRMIELAKQSGVDFTKVANDLARGQRVGDVAKNVGIMLGGATSGQIGLFPEYHKKLGANVSELGREELGQLQSSILGHVQAFAEREQANISRMAAGARPPVQPPPPPPPPPPQEPPAAETPEPEGERPKPRRLVSTTTNTQIDPETGEVVRSSTFQTNKDPIGSRYGALFANPDLSFTTASGDVPSLNQLATIFRQDPRMGESILRDIMGMRVAVPGTGENQEVINASGYTELTRMFSGKFNPKAADFFKQFGMSETADFYRKTAEEFDTRSGIGKTREMLESFAQGKGLAYTTGEGEEKQAKTIGDVVKLLSENQIGKADFAALTKIVEGKGSLTSYVGAGVSEGWMPPEIGEALLKFSGQVEKAGGATDKMAKQFADFSETAEKHVSNWQKSLDDMQKSLTEGKKLGGTELSRAQYNVGEMKPMAELMGRTPESRVAFAQGLAGAGMSEARIVETMQSLARFQEQQQAEADAMSATGEASTRGGGRGGLGQRAIRGLTTGGLGELGWTMMNARRLWGMTGGAFAGRVEDYAKYSAEQQTALTGLGLTSEYTGAGADVIRQKNNLMDFERANQKAAWNIGSPVFNAISGVFGGGDPNRPGFANYASNLLALGVGLPIATGFAGSIAGMAGLGTIAGVGGAAASTGLAGGLAGIAGATLPFAIPAALGLAGAYAVGEPFRENQNFGMAATERMVEYNWRMSQASKGKLFDTSTGETEEEHQRWKEKQWWYGTQSEERALGEIVSRQTDNKVSRDIATSIAASVSKTSGLSYEQLNTEQGRAMIAKLGLYPDQQGMQERVGLALTAARLGGAQFGSDQYMKTIAQVMDNSKFTNRDVLRAQETAQRMGQLSETGRSLGVELPELGNLEFLANATPQQKMQLEKIGRFDQRTWSDMARQALAGQMRERVSAPGITGTAPYTPDVEQMRRLITMEANGLQPLGTLTTMDFSQTARQVGLQGIGYTAQQAATMPLMSTAQIEAQSRYQRDYYNQYQYQQQLSELQRSTAYAMGGRVEVPVGPTGAALANKVYDFAGSFNLQQQSQAEQLRHSRQSMAFEGGTFGGRGYGWMGKSLSELQKMSVEELGQSGGDYKRALEAMEFQKRSSDISRGYQREDAQISWQRGTTQLGWQGQDLLTNFNRSMEQFNWSLKDLNTNFQRGQQGFAWQQQGLNLQANQQAVSFGWQLEDIDTAMRYSTGRERRQLARQRERAATTFGFQEQGLNLQQEQLKTREKWAEEDFAKETARLEERRKWAEQDFEKEKKRLEVRQEWLDEDLARALKRIEEQAALEDEQLAKRKKDLQDEAKLNSLRFADNKKNLETMAGIQKRQLNDSIKQFEIDKTYREDAIKMAQEHTLEMTKLADAAAAIGAVQKAMFDDFAFQVSNPDGPVPTAMRLFVQNVADAFSDQDSAGQYSKTLIGGFKVFFKAAQDFMAAQMFGQQSDQPEPPIDYGGPH